MGLAIFWPSLKQHHPISFANTDCGMCQGEYCMLGCDLNVQAELQKTSSVFLSA